MGIPLFSSMLSTTKSLQVVCSSSLVVLASEGECMAICSRSYAAMVPDASSIRIPRHTGGPPAYFAVIARHACRRHHRSWRRNWTVR